MFYNHILSQPYMVVQNSWIDLNQSSVIFVGQASSTVAIETAYQLHTVNDQDQFGLPE